MSLGIALLIIGSLVVSLSLLLIHHETVIATSLNTTTTGWYYSDKFRADNGYWLEIDISTNASSTLYVTGQTVGQIFTVSGTTYQYTVQITEGDVYQVQVQNTAAHGGFLGLFQTPDNNNISGSFELERVSFYFLPVMSLGGVFLAVGLLMILSLIYVEYRTRRIAKSLYECPRCRKEVSIGLQACPYCKLDLTKYWVRCKYCNKLYDSHLEKCPKCGAEAEI